MVRAAFQRNCHGGGRRVGRSCCPLPRAKSLKRRKKWEDTRDEKEASRSVCEEGQPCCKRRTPPRSGCSEAGPWTLAAQTGHRVWTAPAFPGPLGWLGRDSAGPAYDFPRAPGLGHSSGGTPGGLPSLPDPPRCRPGSAAWAPAWASPWAKWGAAWLPSPTSSPTSPRT